MISKAEKIYIFEEYRLEPDKRSLFRANGSLKQIPLSNRPFQVLLYLIENRDRFVSRDELLEKFWDGRDVYDTAITKAVGAIRKASTGIPRCGLSLESSDVDCRHRPGTRRHHSHPVLSQGRDQLRHAAFSMRDLEQLCRELPCSHARGHSRDRGDHGTPAGTAAGGRFISV